MAAEMREATCAGTQTSEAPTLSGSFVTDHYSVIVASRWPASHKNNNQVRVPQYFNISSKFNLIENLCIVLQIYAQSDVTCIKVYNSTFHVCVAIPIHKLNPYFCCFKVLVIGFLFYIASINNDDLKTFHPGQRHLTRSRYICIKTAC